MKLTNDAEIMEVANAIVNKHTSISILQKEELTRDTCEIANGELVKELRSRELNTKVVNIIFEGPNFGYGNKLTVAVMSNTSQGNRGITFYD